MRVRSSGRRSHQQVAGRDSDDRHARREVSRRETRVMRPDHRSRTSVAALRARTDAMATAHKVAAIPIIIATANVTPAIAMPRVIANTMTNSVSGHGTPQ